MKSSFKNHIPRFYINPNTGRLIKSSGKIYKSLKKKKSILTKDKCLYNVKSAKRCFIKLLTLYPNIVYPSSNFINIPKTYKKGKIRAFIKDTNQNKIIGFIDKNGVKYKLRKKIKTKYIPKVPIIHDEYNTLSKIISKIEPIDKFTQRKIENQILNYPTMQKCSNINILFNPLQNDFIPLNQKINSLEKKHILHLINKELIPKKLPLISNKLLLQYQNHISGIIKTQDSILGFIDINNNIHRLNTPIKIIDISPNLSDSKIQTISKQRIEQPKITEEVSEKVSKPISEEISEEVSEPITEVSEPISEEVSEPITEEVSEEVSEPITEEVSEEVSEPITEVSEEVSEPITEEVSEPITEEVSEEVSEPIIEVSEEVSEPIIEEVSEDSEPITEEVSEEVSEPITEEISEEVSEPITEEVSEEVSEPITEEVSEEVSEPITEEISEEVSEPITEEVSEEVSEPITEEISEEVSEPITEEVSEEVSEPITEEISEEVSEPITEEVSKPISQPITETVSKFITQTIPTLITQTIPTLITQTISKPITEEVSKPIITETIDTKIVESLPLVSVTSLQDKKDLINELNKAPIISDKQTIDIVEKLKCLDGEQYDVNEKRCLPCTMYGLVWDFNTKSCKIMLKDDIVKEQEQKLLKRDLNLQKLKIVQTENDDIIGYLEK
jgi:hypothetical protein